MAVAHPPLPRLLDVAERGWRLRLHAGAAPPTTADAARRAVRALLAPPGDVAAGFALLRPAEGGGWALLVHVWRDGTLLREALLLPEDRAPPRRCPALARSLGTTDDVLLLAREAAAWARHGGDADAYLLETLS
jgi:hypothetical protein